MAQPFFSESQQSAIVASIQAAEKNTSGEIQVHIENHCKEEVLDRAANVFAALKMHLTKDRNGVLFYLAVKDKKFAILGDAGINTAVSDDFWNHIRNNMQEKFKNGEFTEGLCEGINETGIQLKKYFPYQQTIRTNYRMKYPLEKNNRVKRILIVFILILQGFAAFTKDDFPDPPNPPSLIVDWANLLSEQEEQQLEAKLEAYEDSTSNEISIVTLDTIGRLRYRRLW